MQSAFNSLLRRLYFVAPLKNSEKNFSGLKKRPKGAKSDLRKVLLGASFFKSAQIRRFSRPLMKHLKDFSFLFPKYQSSIKDSK